MKLQNLTVIFIVIILPIILIVSLYINTGIKTIKYQALYDTALLNATHDAIYAFEQNTANNKYSDNAETKRSIIKSSIKMFETSLANAAGISAYSSDEIEEYIPAIVFGLYDGFYMYAPSYNTQTGKYEHGLKNYVYYSETLDDGTVIRYSLDNYVSVTVEIGGQYYIKEGYLINLNDLKNIDSDNNGKADEVTTLKYKAEELVINKETINGEDNYDAIEYFKDAYDFSYWFLKEAKIQEKKKDGTTVTYLNIGNSNDPENENSAFVQHKRKIIKEKMEGVLNSTITAYSKRVWGQNYKMPKLSEEDLEKIYNNISVTTFFQGKRIGLTKYNGYCVLNSTNSREYVNPNLMYFIDNTGYYHDIRCEECKNATTLTGYRIGSFGNKKVTDLDGNVSYEYDHNELACYECINGTENSSGLVYDYITGEKPNNEYSETEWKNTKESYWTSLARERYNAAKLVQSDIIIEDEEQETYTITYTYINDDNLKEVFYEQKVNIGNSTTIILDKPSKVGYKFLNWVDNLNAEYIEGQIVEFSEDIELKAKWEKEEVTLSFDANIPEGETYSGTLPTSEKLDQGSTFTLSSIGSISRSGYAFMGWSTDKSATSGQSTVIMDEDKTVYAIWRQYIAKYALQDIWNGTETEISFYSSLQDAVNVINVGSTKKKVITLLTDITENITIKNDDDRVLNLNGKTLTGNILNNSINLTVENGNINGKFENFETGGAKELIFNNVTIDGKSQSAIYRVSGSTGYWNVEFNNCTITSYNGTATIEEVNDNITINNTTISNTGQGHAIRLKRKTGSAGGGTITINSGTITNSSASKQTIYLQDHDGGYECKLTMTGGTINNSGNAGAISGGKNAGIYITGGIVQNSGSSPIISLGKKAKLTISGGTIRNTDGKTYISGDESVNIAIGGVTIENSSSNPTISVGESSTVSISSGTINNTGGATTIDGDESVEITISGGTIQNSSSNPTIWIGKNSDLTISGGTTENIGSGSAITGIDFDKITLDGNAKIKNNSENNATIYIKNSRISVPKLEVIKNSSVTIINENSNGNHIHNHTIRENFGIVTYYCKVELNGKNFKVINQYLGE